MKEHFDQEILENTHLVLNLPGKMRADKRLRNNFRVQVLVTELSNLSKAVGYAYCSNNYLSKKMGVSIDTIKRDLKLLSDCGYIQRETTFGSFKKERKIYVGDLFSNNFYEGARMPLAKVQGCPNKESLSYSIDKDKERNRSPNSKSSDDPPIFSPSIHSLCETLRSNLQKHNPNFKDPKESKKTWTSWLQSMERLIRIDKRSEEDIKLILEWVDGHDFWFANIQSPQKLRAKFDTLILQRKQQSERKTPEQKKEMALRHNHEIATKWMKKILQHSQEKGQKLGIKFHVGRDYIELGSYDHPSGRTISYKESGFQNQLSSELRKLNVFHFVD